MKTSFFSSVRPFVALLIASLVAVGLPFLAASAEPKAKAAKPAQPKAQPDKNKDNDKGKDKDNAKEKGKEKELKGKASDLATNPKNSPKSDKKKNAKETPVKSTGDVTVLRECYNTLTLGMHIYEGHRRRAINHIDKAAHALGTDFKGDAGQVSSRVLSDAQLIAVKAILEKSRSRFTGEALEEVDLAIKELGTALSLPRKR